MASDDKRSRRSDREGKDTQEPEAQSLISPVPPTSDGDANVEPNAASSSPLLVRPEGKGEQRHSLEKEKFKHKKRKKSRQAPANKSNDALQPQSQPQETDAARSAPGTLRGRDQLGSVERQTNSQYPPMATSMWHTLSTCLCWGGSLRAPVSPTELPLLSSEAQAIVRSLDATTSKSHVEVVVSRTDDMPFTSSNTSNYGHPVVLLHLLDLCTGLPFESQLSTKPAVFSATKLNAFEWNSSHRWTSLRLTKFISPRVLLLFELVQPRQKKLQRRGSFRRRSTDQKGSRTRENDNQVPSRIQCKQLAWGFFRPVSDRGNIRLASLSLPDHSDSQQSALRIQLFSWRPLSWTEAQFARSKFQWDPKASGGVPTVFLQYQKRNKTQLPCSLHVDMYPVASAPTPRRRKVEHSDDEKNPTTNQTPPEVLTSESHNGATPSEESASAVVDPLLKCKRIVSEPCLVPQRVLHRLPTGKKGCSCLAFSLDGLFLAAAVHHLTTTAEEWLVQVFQVNTGTLWQSCSGHQGMIYSLEWGAVGSSATKALVSASSDGRAMVWSLRLTPPSAQTNSLMTFPAQVLQHVPSPAFVYCALFHPTQTQLAVTGASDGYVRLWQIRVDTDGAAKSARSYTSSPVHQWRVNESVKNGAVHSIRIENKQGGRLFCGDASGAITVWSPDSSTAEEFKFNLVKTVRTGQRSIASMSLHPRKQHLLVLTHPHALLQYETRSFLLLHKNYSGIECDQLLAKAAFSPDGQFVVSGSEDGVPHLFGAVRGQRLEDSSRGVWGRRFFHGYPLTEIAWSPSTHVVAMGAYGENHPILVLCAHRDDKQLDESMWFQNQQVEDQSRQTTRTSSSAHRLDKQCGADLTNSKAPPDRRILASAIADPDASERAQRALARRKLRLQATLAREIEATSSVSSSPVK